MSSKKTDPQVTIDLMGRADLPEILAIEKESFISPWTQGMFEQELQSTLAQCLVIRITSEGRSVIGAYIIFRLVADETHLYNLAVNKQFKRNGLATNSAGNNEKYCRASRHQRLYIGSQRIKSKKQ